MLISKILKKTAISSCVGFTLLVALYSFIMVLIYNASEGIYMSPATVLLLYPFSFFFSFANNVARETKIKLSLKLLIHFLLVISGFGFFILLPQSNTIKPSAITVVFFFAIFLYIVCAAVFLAIRSNIKRKNEQNKEYTSVYLDRNKK